MELEGISLDTEMLSDFSEELSEEIVNLDKKYL